MGMFAMLEESDSAAAIPIPSLPELNKGDMMLMEKETTGIYLSGHPMDDYRAYLKNTRVVPIGDLMGEETVYEDEQIVSIAGVIQSTKMKTTRNNTMMAYVTLEDDTAAIEMLAFSRIIDQYGSYLRENIPVVVVGKISVRDDKEPQLIINRVRLLSDYANGVPETERVETIRQSSVMYLRLPDQEDPLFHKVKAILNMFPGNGKAVIYFESTKQRCGTQCAIDERMVNELVRLLGEGNVVLK